MISGNIALFALMLFPLIMAIALHEAAHAWTAYQFGDNTAYAQGRVTLNPIKHIDPLGTIVVPIAIWFISNQTFIFGWAKPVPFNPRSLKNYRRDASWIAAAGPLSNFLMAFIWAVILFILAKINLKDTQLILSQYLYHGTIDDHLHGLNAGLIIMAFFGIHINLILGIFNLIPLPPLDGGHIAGNLLPAKLSYEYRKIEPYGIFILIALIWLNILPIGRLVSYFLFAIIKFIFA